MKQSTGRPCKVQGFIKNYFKSYFQSNNLLVSLYENILFYLIISLSPLYKICKICTCQTVGSAVHQSDYCLLMTNLCRTSPYIYTPIRYNSAIPSQYLYKYLASPLENLQFKSCAFLMMDFFCASSKRLT